MLDELIDHFAIVAPMLETQLELAQHGRHRRPLHREAATTPRSSSAIEVAGGAAPYHPDAGPRATLKVVTAAHLIASDGLAAGPATERSLHAHHL